MRTILLLLSLLILTNLHAQDIAFNDEQFPDQKEALKEAMKSMDKGDDWLRKGSDHYRDALPFFKRAHEFNPNNAELNFKLGKCYLMGSYERTRSLEYFEKAKDLNPDVDPNLLYFLGQAYHINLELDSALKAFDLFLKSVPRGASFEKVKQTEQFIWQCKTGKELVKKPARVFIDNIGDAINTPFPEYDAVISTDESVMMFTSRRKGSTGGKTYGSQKEFYEDIYVSENVNGRWQLAENIGKPINTNRHDATVSISPDGQELLTFSEGNLYTSRLEGDVWQSPRPLGQQINTPYHESSACYSADGRTLYFVSTRPDGSMGGRDIFVSQWDPVTEKWGAATNIGSTINTRYDEESVFIHPDGKTLYFSSRGHNSMGGYDVFKSVREGNSWSRPINLGHPINTPDDDVFFMTTASGEHGYYTSVKPDGQGEKDIYRITFLGPEKQVVLNTEDNLLAVGSKPVREVVIEPEVEITGHKVTIFKGTVTDDETGEALSARIELIDNEAQAIVAEFSSNSKSGKYLVALPPGKNYGIAVKADGYLFHSENFVIPESAAFKEIVKDIKMQKLVVGKSIILNNIFFEIDKYDLSETSEVELRNVFELLRDNSSIRVEISGHTDNTGSDKHNQQLSENRAKAVVDYLANLGIKADRMEFKGYGETQPVAGNEVEEDRKLNRRTEFKIIE